MEPLMWGWITINVILVIGMWYARLDDSSDNVLPQLIGMFILVQFIALNATDVFK